MSRRDAHPTTMALRPREAWEALGISRGMLYALMGRGELGYVRVGSDRRIPVTEIERYLVEHLVRGGAR